MTLHRFYVTLVTVIERDYYMLKGVFGMASKTKTENNNILANKQRQKELNNYMLILGKVITHIRDNQQVKTSDEFVYLEEMWQAYNKFKLAIGQVKRKNNGKANNKRTVNQIHYNRENK